MYNLSLGIGFYEEVFQYGSKESGGRLCIDPSRDHLDITILKIVYCQKRKFTFVVVKNQTYYCRYTVMHIAHRTLTH